MPERRVAAVDLGAQSGRVAVGGWDGSAVRVEIGHHFPNVPLWLPDGLHWNLPGLFERVLDGLAAAAAAGPLDSVGVDSWGCDYALLDGAGHVLGMPYHYRDPARTAQPVIDRTFSRVDRHELYARTGIQTMPINTVFQLVAEDSAIARAADRIALIPDLIGLWLTGTIANEITNASTTGLLDARGTGWVRDLIAGLGLPPRPFASDTAAPGTVLGPVLGGHARAGAAIGTTVRTVASHDTASAFAGAGLGGAGAAVLSSGTWSLLGIELPAPELGPEAESFNLTNERGIAGTTRLLRNVMGMWLIEECRREFARSGSAPDYDALYREAAAAPAEVPLFDPDDAILLAPGPMAGRIEQLCTTAGQPAPASRGELVRSILVSLACKYRYVLERLEIVTGRRIETVQVVGGGVRNRMLCRLTADILGREVLAGPVEATLLGNVLVQLLAVGELSSIDDLRRVATESAAFERHQPGDGAAAQETYQRFLGVTGLDAGRRATATA